MKKILIMGLPGSGKTTLAKDLTKELNADWINADDIRKKFNDWDFSKTGVLNQAKRMRNLAAKSSFCKIVQDLHNCLMQFPEFCDVSHICQNIGNLK